MSKGLALKILILVFVVSRLFLFLSGIRFDISPLGWYYQFLDPVDLKGNLLQSLLYLHSQPPGFNFLLGIVLKIAPGLEGVFFQIIYFMIGMTTIAGLFLLLSRFRINPWWALVLTIFYALSPPVILYENWLFYTYPIVMLLTVSALFLDQSVRRKNHLYLFLFFLTAGMVVVTRSLFPPIWFAVILSAVIFSRRWAMRKVILAALLPSLVILGLTVKNYLLFREGQLSSWLGMNLMKMTFTIPIEKITPLIAEGSIPEIVIEKPFQDPTVYRAYADFDTTTGIAVLDKKYKSTGYINYNHVGYIAVSRQYYHTALALFKRYPGYYLVSVFKSFYAYLRPTSSFQDCGNLRRLVPWKGFYENYLLGDILSRVSSMPYTTRLKETRTIHFNFLYLFVPVILVWAVILAIRGPRIIGLNREEMITIRYMVFNILYCMIIGNLFETGENMRFRFLVLPFFYIFLGLFFRRGKLDNE